MRLPTAVVALALVLTPAGAGAHAASPSSADPPVHAVGVRSETLVDPSRPTPPVPGLQVAGAATRTVPVTVWYPARGAPTETAVADARPAAGRFPLVVYAPGNGARGADAPEVVRSWASRGYVVVAPDFPVSSRATSNLAALDDWANQSGDVRFVLDEATDRAGIAGLGPTTDRRRIGLAGHSLGAMTVLDLAFGTDADRRVDAVATFAGIPLLGGADVSSRPLPLLLVHGTDDPVVPVDQSRTMFADAAGPHALVLVDGGGHSTYLQRPDPDHEAALSEATALFWDATLRRARDRRDRDVDPDDRLLELTVPGRVTVEVGPSPNLRGVTTRR